MLWNSKLRKLELEGPGFPKDYISIDNCDRYMSYLEGASKGGNSNVFKVIDPNNDEVDRVIKFCKFYTPTSNSFAHKRLQRFEREIRALKQAASSEYSNYVIQIIHDGQHVIKNKIFRYYVMELAESDLRTYLADEGEVLLQQKLVLCSAILQTVKSLHQMNIYHRDLKPENILYAGPNWKIADLGLINFRHEDTDLDEEKEKIGPFGLLSPEATNKALGNKGLAEFNFDCVIDNKSDIFQLGKIFWYILQGEIPTGQLALDDFKLVGQASLFNNVILPMLQYAKTRRPAIEEIESRITPISQQLAIQ